MMLAVQFRSSIVGRWAYSPFRPWNRPSPSELAEVFASHPVFQADRDYPETQVEPRTVVICSVPRSGSSFLADLMAGTCLLGRPTEYFSTNFGMPSLIRRYGAKDLAEYVTGLRAHRTTPNGVFSVKLHFHQYAFSFGRADLAKYFPNITYVQVVRRDPLAQAVSWAKASATGHWLCNEPNPVKAPLTRAAIEKFRKEIEYGQAGWVNYLKRVGATPLTFFYEDIVENPAAIFPPLFRQLGMAMPQDFQVPKVVLVKQADEVNAYWISKLMADRP